MCYDRYTMRCGECKSSFSAADYQPAPGGSSAPGVFLICSIACLGACIAGVLFGFGRLLFWFSLGVAVFAAIQIPVDYFDCRSDGGYANHNGITCPSCEHVNTPGLYETQLRQSSVSADGHL